MNLEGVHTKYEDGFANKDETVSLLAADHIVELIVRNINTYITNKKLDQLVVPFVTEMGLSSAMEPSTLLDIHCDDNEFYIDTEEERGEPPKIPVDFFCGDKA